MSIYHNKKYKVIESGSISFINEMIKNLILNEKKRVLLICDIDDTLIRPIVNIGSDSWFCRSIKDEHINIIRKKLGLIYSLLTFSGVEKETDVFVNQIDVLTKTDNLKFFCLTSRSVLFHSYTVMHFKETGYDKVFVRPNMLLFDDHLYLNHDADIESVPHVRYMDNICTCSGLNKGDVLIDILKRSYLNRRIDFDFDVIIFIDDSINNIDKMNNGLKDFLIDFNDIESICIHYTYMEEHKNNYSIKDFIDDNEKMDKLMEFKNYINNKVNP